MDLADKIKYIRNYFLDQTQEAFASNIGVTRSTIKNWENGVSRPTVSNLLMIAMIGEVTLDCLIFDDKPFQLSTLELNDNQYNIIDNLIKYFNDNLNRKNHD